MNYPTSLEKKLFINYMSSHKQWYSKQKSTKSPAKQFLEITIYLFCSFYYLSHYKITRLTFAYYYHHENISVLALNFLFSDFTSKIILQSTGFPFSSVAGTHLLGSFERISNSLSLIFNLS